MRQPELVAGATAATLVIVALGGCAWTSDDGRRHHLVLGFGVVTTHDSSGQHDLSLIDARASRTEIAGIVLGATGETRGLYVGHFRRQSVEVRPDADLLLSAEAGDRGFIVTATRPEAAEETP